MRFDLSAIPEPSESRLASGVAILSRLYRDIGLAAVAQALGARLDELEPDLQDAILRGKGFLTMPQGLLAT
jgi:hypothetical protein